MSDQGTNSRKRPSISNIDAKGKLPKDGKGRFQVAAEVTQIIHDNVQSFPKKGARKYQRFLRNKKGSSETTKHKQWYYVGLKQPSIELAEGDKLTQIGIKDKSWTVLDNSEQSQYVVEQNKNSLDELVVAILHRCEAQRGSGGWKQNILMLNTALKHKPNQICGKQRNSIASK